MSGGTTASRVPRPAPVAPSKTMVLRDKVIAMRDAYHRGQATLDQMHAAADEYIAAVTLHVREHGSPELKKKFRPPSRAYILRAL